MDRSSDTTHASTPRAEVQLRDKRKDPIPQPDLNTSKRSIFDRLKETAKIWSSSPRLWPMGFLIESPYSPLRVERELPNFNWRDAFEDLLALEFGGQMITQESREAETAVAAKLGRERATYCIGKLKEWNENADGILKTEEFAREICGSAGVTALEEDVRRANKRISEQRKLIGARAALAETLKTREDNRRGRPASMHKERGQWIASLITSGALPGWRSTLQDSSAGAHITLKKTAAATAEDGEGITFTEHGSKEFFVKGKPLEWGSPTPPVYRLPEPGPRGENVQNDDQSHVGSNPHFLANDLFLHMPLLWSRTPHKPYFRAQHTVADRIRLPNGETSTVVTLSKVPTDGQVEAKVFIQKPGRLLQEVEDARASIEDRMYGFDQLPPIEKLFQRTVFTL